MSIPFPTAFHHMPTPAFVAEVSSGDIVAANASLEHLYLNVGAARQNTWSSLVTVSYTHLTLPTNREV